MSNIKLIINNKVMFVNKIPEKYNKKIVVPFNWGYLYENRKRIGTYQYLE